MHINIRGTGDALLAEKARGGGTVFIVDDDARFRDSLDTLLCARGLTTKCYATADAFLEGFAPDRPECLLLDMRLPGMSGMELQKELAARQVSIPVIIVSACADPALMHQAKAAGAVDYIVKPYSVPTLLNRICEALDGDARTLGRS